MNCNICGVFAPEFYACLECGQYICGSCMAAHPCENIIFNAKIAECPCGKTIREDDVEKCGECQAPICIGCWHEDNYNYYCDGCADVCAICGEQIGIDYLESGARWTCEDCNQPICQECKCNCRDEKNTEDEPAN